MSNLWKNSWWVVLLLAAGAVIFLFSLHQPKPAGDQGVVLKDIFHQQPPMTESGNASAVKPKKADPVPPMAIVTAPEVNGKESGITIQVYSFQDRNRAETALQALKNSGYSAFMIVSDLGEKGTWYRVRVGGIPDDAAAHKMLDQIRKDYNSGFIVNK